jgi:hypothetical protein
MLEIILALVSRIGDLEKVVVALKNDLAAVKSGTQTVQQVAPDVAAQVETLAADAAESAASLGIGGGLSQSLLALLGGVAHEVGELFGGAQTPAAAPATAPATAPALPAPVVVAPAAVVTPEGHPVGLAGVINAANAAADAGGANA